jgi:hypothetical protein
MYLMAGMVFACSADDEFAGTYETAAEASSGGAEAVLELKEGGEGVWRVNDDEVSFTWYLKRDELRLNTKDGGVLVGKIDGDTIQVTLPGDKIMVFKKSP